MNTPNRVREHIKLWARRVALRWARKLVDLADDRLHAAEVKLRNDLASRVVPVKQSLTAEHQQAEARKLIPARGEEAGSTGRRRETFQQWEARRSGVAPVSKKEARRRRALTAAEFDLRFAR